LTHHATTLLLAPALLVYLFVWRRDWWRNGRAWRWALLAALPPLLLYLYIPLRSGPDASPWYHQRLGDDVLTLFDNSLPALLDFVTGSVDLRRLLTISTRRWPARRRRSCSGCVISSGQDWC
jgi:4-amino-4-deoxy-L-arabinose transferase-like glycosyltransferase